LANKYGLFQRDNNEPCHLLVDDISLTYATYHPSHQNRFAMAPIVFTLNENSFSFDGDPQMPLLWVIRDFAGLKGTKFGCGIAQCGACTVHLDGTPVRSCSLPVSVAAGKKITTIEGVGDKPAEAVQQAWTELQVPQCGYCQSGQVMAATALLKRTPKPSDKDIDAAMQGIICRCGTYPRIRAAIHRAAELMQA
jgi:isoquinoline 1-oxidoreductase alpha subunit